MFHKNVLVFFKGKLHENHRYIRLCSRIQKKPNSATTAVKKKRRVKTNRSILEKLSSVLTIKLKRCILQQVMDGGINSSRC